MNIDNIKEININGYHSKDKLYKFTILFNNEKTQEIYLKWKKISKAVKNIKKKLNNNIYDLFIYTINIAKVIKDKRYKYTKNFIYGNKFQKNIRKMDDIQSLFDLFMELKNETNNKQAIDSIFRNIFITL